MTAPTLTVGSGAIALVQAGTIVDVLPTYQPLTPTLPAASAAGTALVAIISNRAVAPGASVGSAPSGFILLSSKTETSGGGPSYTDVEVWIYLNNPGGILSATFVATGDTSGNFIAQLSEWRNVAYASSLETNGTSSATAGTTQTVATSAGIVNAGDVAIAAWHQFTNVSQTATFTSPTGWTRLGDDGTVTAGGHQDAEYMLTPPVGPPLNLTFTSNRTTTSGVAVIVALKAASPSLDQSSYVTHDSLHVKLNTLDAGLMLGGRHLLESAGAGDNSGHLLEDGSGVRLLDTYLPQLGDPVTLTNPTWSGRVVSVSSEDIFDPSLRTNYSRASITATNSAAAPGGTAPGDFADTAVGGYHLLEDGFKRILEDGTGDHLLEGTAFVYRNLSLRKSQNQDGTTATSGYLETFEGGFAAGQTFSLTSVNLGIAAVSYTITNVTTSFIGVDSAPTAVYGIDFGDAYPTLQNSGGGVLTRTSSQATQQLGVAMPGGVLGYASITADQTGITATADITGLSLTVTVGSGRRIELECPCFVQSDTVADLFDVSIQEGATVLNFVRIRTDVANTPKNGFVKVVLSPTVGVHTYKVTMGRNSGAGTGQYRAGSTFPSSLTCKDAGT